MSDRGSAGLSVVLLTPVVLALMAFAVLAGRIGTAAPGRGLRGPGRGAGGQPAPRRCEWPMRTPGGRPRRRCAAPGIECASTSVRDRTSAPAEVTATVSCAVKLSDLVDLALPGQTTITASASAPVDVYRGGS